MDEYLIYFADNIIDTSDFYRRYMAGFVVSTRERLLSHCGSDYTRNVTSSSSLYDPLDTKDLMCLMLGFTPIVESTSLFTDTAARQSQIAKLSGINSCIADTIDTEVLTYVETTNCMFYDLVDAYRMNSTVKYPNCSPFDFTNAYTFIVDRNAVIHVANISADFTVDAAVRMVSDFQVVYGPDSAVDASGTSEDELVGRQFAPLTEISGVTIYYNNQVTINVIYEFRFTKYV